MARPTLFANRKLLKLAQRLQSRALAVGTLELIWNAANETGNPVLGDEYDIETIADWRGERGELVNALLECGTAGGGAGFIERRSDGLFEIHDYWHHAPAYVRKRAQREQQRRDKGDELRLNGQSATGHRLVSDQAVTGQNGEFRDGERDLSRTPAPAPAPNKNTRRQEPTGRPKFHQEVIDAYHELLPDLPRVKTWNDRRGKKLDARIRERLKDGKAADTLAYWKSFFEKVAASDFLCGRKTDWRADLEWLIEARHFEKTIEGGFDNADNRGRVVEFPGATQ